MTKDEILKELEAFQKENCNPYLSGYRGAPYGNKEDLASPDFKGFTSDSWVCGGVTGGTCWGGEANEPVSADDEAELTLLDEFLERKMPDLTFIKYKKLAKFIKTQEWNRSEYYGNQYCYKASYITFEDIANCLGSD